MLNSFEWHLSGKYKTAWLPWIWNGGLEVKGLVAGADDGSVRILLLQ
jgi:hypothetical protein